MLIIIKLKLFDYILNYSEELLPFPLFNLLPVSANYHMCLNRSERHK